MPPPSRHRKGHAYRQARRAMFEMFGDVCHLCGHAGAGEADHLDPLAYNPDQPVDPHAMRPAHGTSCPCPTCGRLCNQERGARQGIASVKTTRAW